MSLSPLFSVTYVWTTILLDNYSHSSVFLKSEGMNMKFELVTNKENLIKDKFKSALSPDSIIRRDALIKKASAIFKSINSTQNAYQKISTEIIIFIGEHEEAGDLSIMDCRLLQYHFDNIQSKTRFRYKSTKKTYAERKKLKQERELNSLLAKELLKRLADDKFHHDRGKKTILNGKQTAIDNVGTDTQAVKIITDLAVSLEDL